MIKLDRLVAVLSGHGARLAGARQVRDVELRSVAVYDPASPGPTVGDAFLAIGVSSLADAVRLAVDARASVVLARVEPGQRSEPPAEVREGSPHVLLLDPHASWSQVAGVVYGLVLEGRETESGRGPSDLFALADTLATAVGGPVTIEDPRSRVMAYSGPQQDADPARLDTILGRRVPDWVRALFDERGVFTHLATSDEPLYIPAAPEHGLRGRTVAAVRAGKEPLGSVWVTCDAPLDAARTRILTESAHTVAQHLLRSRVSADLERQVESELVIQLLEGTPDASAVLAKLGLAPKTLRVLALQAHTAGESNAAILLAFERATTGFGWTRPGRSTLFGNTIYTLLPCDDDLAPARGWLADIGKAMPGHVTLMAGIGAPATASDIPASRQEADESLALHSTRPATAAVSYDEAWDEILLQRLRTAAAAGRLPSRGPVAELARHDDRHNTPYLATLRAWLEAQGDLNTAAARLEVHPNTIRYRLRRMHQLCQLRLNDPRERLAMLVALAIRDQPPDG